MEKISINSVGKVSLMDDNVNIILHPSYHEGLKGLEGYSHVCLLWWCDGCNDLASRQTIVTSTPYTDDEIGVFATRSPQRPNPVALTVSEILHIDLHSGLLVISWIDAKEGSPVIDIKPYIPSLDRVEDPVTPSWLANWPRSLEASANFDWSSIFNM